jgi:hypothetical protein
MVGMAVGELHFGFKCSRLRVSGYPEMMPAGTAIFFRTIGSGRFGSMPSD